MRVELVTSFSLAGAALYGRRCVESVTKHWPHPMTVYADVPMSIAGVTVRTTGDIPGWRETRDRLPVSRPDAPKTGFDEWTRKPDSYLWNAQKFAVKPFVWHHAAETLGSGLLVWLDGDTVTTADVPDGLIESLMIGVDVAYLGRGSMHPETGFIVFRVPEALPLLRWCRDHYTLGAFAGLSNGWTDCHVLRAALALGADRVKARDLTSHRFVGPWRSKIDAFALSPIGPYLEHRKGTQPKRGAA